MEREGWRRDRCQTRLCLCWSVDRKNAENSCRFLEFLLTSLAEASCEAPPNGSGLLLPPKGSCDCLFHELPPCHESSSPKEVALFSNASSKAAGCDDLKESLNPDCDSLKALRKKS